LRHAVKLMLKDASVHFLGLFKILQLEEFGEKRKVFLSGNVAPLIGQESGTAVERIAPGSARDPGLVCRFLPMMGYRKNHMPKVKHHNFLEVQDSKDTESRTLEGTSTRVRW